MTSFPQIVVGTYEEFVLGYKPKIDEGQSNKYKLVQSIATHSHQASVRCIAAHGHLMASSGADEYINIYDMNAMEVLTVINYHDSTVTCLEFTTDGSHLITANQSGDIAIFRCRDWNLVKLWKQAHKHANGVISMSIHPTGSLLMTAGADNIVRFWNLVKGRQAYATNFSKKCSVGNALSFSLWSRNGNYYTVCVGNKLEVYKTKTAAVVYDINMKSRAVCASFTEKNFLCIGAEDGSIEIHSIIKKNLLLQEQAHKNRVKSMAAFAVEKSGTNKIQNYLVSADSKGVIKLWWIKKKEPDYFLSLKAEVDCDCRITCLALVAPKDVKKEKNPTSDSSTVNEINMNETVTVEHADSTSNKNKSNTKKTIAKGKQKIFKEKIVENGNLKKNSEKTGLSQNKLEISKTSTPNLKKENKKSPPKGKKRTHSESNASDKRVTLLNGSSASPKYLKKQKLSQSFQLKKANRTSGKWSVDDV